ncbi:MAG: hypothetical protein U1E22_08760, partial [Coriobacteriia bacterium]|nr:hypothetical protein [Coriobacteriia bacterium]
MFCPQCGSEYVAGISECAGCGIPLVDAAGASQETERRRSMQEPVVVFASSRADLVAIAKSILLSSEID